MEPTAQARQMIALFEHADQKGLSAEDYDRGRWGPRLEKLKPATGKPRQADAAQFDVALTVSAMRYISDLHIGKVNPNCLGFAFDVQSKKYDLAEFLKDHVTRANDIAAVLAKVEPPYPGYRQTIQALQTYLELAKNDDGEQLPPVTTEKGVESGDVYEGVPRLARLLRLLGDLPADASCPPEKALYEGPLVEAVRNFQRRHGRDPDGRIDQQTLTDLNVPLTRRIRQIQLTLERWRWLPTDYRPPLIVVNIPEFHLRAYNQDLTVGTSMKIAVGRAYGHQTPVFSSTMTNVVFRPYWRVPQSIVRTEVLPLVPLLLTHPEYLTISGFELTDNHGNVVSATNITDKTLNQLRAGKLLVRQKPGPNNALGLVKFVFSNNYNVYMHDTPAVESFANSRRDFSHGCIRVEKASDLAAWVLRHNPGWTPDRIRTAMNGSAPHQVSLVDPIPVLIVYGTVVVLEDGVVHFYEDLYGHDLALEQVLAKGYPYSTAWKEK
jgi:murein L,D-transpeptidase YcbB/YkuD